MKSLYESILDDFDKVYSESDEKLIMDFISSNYNIGKCDLTINKESNGFVVNVKGEISITNEDVECLTNGFSFGVIDGDFNLSWAYSIKNLQGGPKYVTGDFRCDSCEELKTLNGAPERVDGLFSCRDCTDLKSLKGAPKYVGHFNCAGCHGLTNLKGAPQNVDSGFGCSHCTGLKNFEGCPSIIKGNFVCNHYGPKSLKGFPKEVQGDVIMRLQDKYTKADIAQVCDVKGEINVI